MQKPQPVRRATILAVVLATVVVHGQANPSRTVAGSAPTIRVDVDATELARHLLRSRLTIPVEPGKVALWYPKWIPGIHGPGAPISNVAGLMISTPDGTPLAWRRDSDELYRLLVDVPDGVETIHVELTYIANQPSDLSVGVDTHGNSDVMAVNFNTCLLYPAGIPADETQVDLRVKLPAGWQFGTALEAKADSEGGAWRAFQQATLETVIDSPLIAGRHYRLFEFKTPDFPQTRMHFVSESPEALKFDQEQSNRYRRLMAEAAELFGGAPFTRYDFLVVCSDKLPSFGLEHHASSLNGMAEEALVDDDLRKGWSAYLLPHELVHAWCGKYRRPAGMYRSEYHSAKRTELLWIYEGLTQYLGHVLTARSGLLTFDEVLKGTAGRVGYLSQREGRRWRSLADTAIANYTLRGRSENWNDLRRGQDYYDEGALFWLEADCIIRDRTDGRYSLDDFCSRFFAAEPDGPKVKPYHLSEVIALLGELADYDWHGLIQRRVYQPHDELQLDALWHAGYEFTYVDERSNYVKRREENRNYISAEYSIGLTLHEDGRVRTVAPGHAADKAGMVTGMKIAGVDGRKFTAKRLRRAISRSTETGQIELLVFAGDKYKIVTVEYGEGERYPSLRRLADQRDWLKEICDSRASEPIAEKAPSKRDS